VAEKPLADTNVILLRAGQLASSPSNYSTGGPIKCSGCPAVFTSQCELHPCSSEPNSQIWICEFCSKKNHIRSSEIPTLPRDGNASFLLQGSEVIDNNTVAVTKKKSSPLVIFCIDISGSMSTRVPSKDTSNDISLTRLECVKKAVQAQIDELAKTQPSTVVVLVSFCEKVTVIGQNSQATEVFSSNLENYDYLLREGVSLGAKFNRPVCEGRFFGHYTLSFYPLKRLNPNLVNSKGKSEESGRSFASFRIHCTRTCPCSGDRNFFKSSWIQNHPLY
jgi:hypothetical protein